MELRREIRLMPGRLIALAVGLLVALVLSMAAGYALRGAQTAAPSVTIGQGVSSAAPQAQGVGGGEANGAIRGGSQTGDNPVSSEAQQSTAAAAGDGCVWINRVKQC